jgi:tape measure domain-containing protein
MPGNSVRWDLIVNPDRYNRGFRDAERTSTRFSASIGKFGALGVRAIGGLGVAMGALGVAGAAMGVKTEAGLEQAEIGFTQLLHSGQKARKFIGDLKTFAAKTPFELPGLIDAARGLLGAGEAANRIIPDLRDLGDASGALGLDQERFGRVMTAVTQIMNKGKLQAEELMQITEAGIPVWPLLAKALHKPVPELQKLISQGKLTSQEVLPKLFDQMHKDYGGSMAKQSQTLSGLWSTFMDTINIGLANVIKPFEGELKGGLTSAIGFVGDAFESTVEFINGTVIPAIKTLRKWWQDNKASAEALADTLSLYLTPSMQDATAGSNDLRSAAQRVYDAASTMLEIALRVSQGFGYLALAAGNVSKWILNLGISAGFVVNAIDKLSGGAGHTADSMIRSMREMRSQTEDQLDRVRDNINNTQRAIDRLHGKTFRFDADDRVTPTIRRIRAEIAATGGSVTARLVRGGAYAEGTMFVPRTGPATLHKGEIVIPAKASEKVRSGGALFGVGGTRPPMVPAMAAAGGADRFELRIFLDSQDITPGVRTQILKSDRRNGGAASTFGVRGNG